MLHIESSPLFNETESRMTLIHFETLMRFKRIDTFKAITFSISLFNIFWFKTKLTGQEYSNYSPEQVLSTSCFNLTQCYKNSLYSSLEDLILLCIHSLNYTISRRTTSVKHYIFSVSLWVRMYFWCKDYAEISGTSIARGCKVRARGGGREILRESF